MSRHNKDDYKPDKPEHWLDIAARYRREMVERTSDPNCVYDESHPWIARERVLNFYGVDLADLKNEALFDLFFPLEEAFNLYDATWKSYAEEFDATVEFVWERYTGLRLRKRKK